MEASRKKKKIDITEKAEELAEREEVMAPKSRPQSYRNELKNRRRNTVDRGRVGETHTNID